MVALKPDTVRELHQTQSGFTERQPDIKALDVVKRFHSEWVLCRQDGVGEPIYHSGYHLSVGCVSLCGEPLLSLRVTMADPTYASI